jgi:hypothetical protein
VTLQPAPDVKAWPSISTDSRVQGKDGQNHFRNFIQSVLGKEQVIAPPTVGQQAAISGHMATLSLKNQKKTTWDETAQKVHFV